MRRRDFIKAIASSTAAWPFRASAQQPVSKIRLVAVLSSTSRVDSPNLAAFRDQLETLGWQEGRNIKVEVRFGESDITEAGRFANELVAMRPDVFFATNTQMVQLIEARTHETPIVFANVPDPVGSKLVASLARPGANITGFTNFEPSVAGKWIEFLKDVAPGLNRIGILLQADNPTGDDYQRAIEAAASAASVEVRPISARDSPTIDAGIETVARQANSGLIVLPSALSVQNRDRIAELALRYRLPAMYPYSEFIAAGGLMAYGIDRKALYRQAALYVDRILKGERAGDLPVQEPPKFELVINLKAAKAMGLTVPRSMLLLADEVIE